MQLVSWPWDGSVVWAQGRSSGRAAWAQLAPARSSLPTSQRPCKDELSLAQPREHVVAAAKRPWSDPAPKPSPGSPASAGGGPSEKASKQAMEPWKLTKLISNAPSLEELGSLMKGHGQSMNPIHITAVMARLATLTEDVRGSSTRGPSGSADGTAEYRRGSDVEVWPSGDGLEAPGEGYGEGGSGGKAGADLAAMRRRGRSSRDGEDEELEQEEGLPAGSSSRRMFGDRDKDRGGRDSDSGQSRQGPGGRFAKDSRQGGSWHTGGPPVRAAAAAQDRQRTARSLARTALRLLQPQILEIDGRGISSVLYSLAQLQLKVPIIDDLLYVSLQHLPSFSCQAFSNTLYAMARLGVKPTREWIVAFFRISQPLLPRFSGQGLANMLWALARLHIRPGVGSGSQAWEKALYGAACVQLETGGFTPQAVANVTWALATLDLYPPQDFQSALVAAARVYLPHFSEQGLANVVWGIAKLRCPVRTSWMDALVRETYSQLPSYSPVVLSTLVYSLALMGRLPASVAVAASGGAGGSQGVGEQAKSSSSISGSISGSGSGTASAAAAVAATQPRAEAQAGTSSSTRSGGTQAGPDGTEPATTDEGAASQASVAGGAAEAGAGQVSSTELAARWGSRLHEQLVLALPTCSPQITANIMYSFGKLAMQPAPELLQALLARSNEQLGSLTTQGLANCVWALARMGAAPGPRWMGAFMEESFARMPLMNAQELSNMVWALAMLKQRPDGMWMARLDRESEDRMPDYQAQNLSNTVHALALFRYAPSPDWQRAFQKQLQVKYEVFSPLQIADTLWSVAELGLGVQTTVLKAMVATVTADVTAVASADLARVLYAMVKLKQAPKPKWLDLFASEIEVQLGTLPLGPLSEAAWALACAGYVPRPAWLAKMDAQVLRLLAPPAPSSAAAAVAAPAAGPQQSAQGSGSQGAGSSSGSGSSVSSSRVQSSPQLQAEALCRLATARPRLGAPPSSEWRAALQQQLRLPGVMKAAPAAYMLLAIQGLVSMGCGTQEQVLGAFLADASQVTGLTSSSRAGLEEAKVAAGERLGTAPDVSGAASVSNGVPQGSTQPGLVRPVHQPKAQPQGAGGVGLVLDTPPVRQAR